MNICVYKDCEDVVHAKGHCNRHYRQIKKYGRIVKTRYDKNEFIIKGDYTEIPLYDNQGKLKEGRIIIDTEDIEVIENYKWCDHHERKHVRAKINGKFQSLHRLVLGIKDESVIIDHIDRNPLNNRKENLRIVTHSQNAQNRSLSSNNTSGVSGVYFKKSKNAWESQINYNGKRYFLGTFKNKDEAIMIRLVYEVPLYEEHSPYCGKYDYLLKEYEERGGIEIHDQRIRDIKSNS